MQNLFLDEGLWFMNSPYRYFYPSDAVLRKYLYQTAVNGRQTTVRIRALARMEQLSAPNREELLSLTGLLNLKTDPIRASVVRIARKSRWKLALLAHLRESGDTEKLEKYTKLLFDQALLIEGLPIEDPVAYAQAVCELMK